MNLPAVLVFTIGVSSTLLAQQEYEIHLDRPVKPGDHCRLSVLGKGFEEMVIEADGQVQMHTKDEFSVEYFAAREVVAVERAGRPIRVSDVIEKLSLIRGANRMELAKPGSVLVASIEGKKKRFEIDGQPVGAESAKALEIVIDISRGGATDDDIFGTERRKKPGDSWDMNRAMAAYDLVVRSNVEARNLNGKVTLESVTQEKNGGILNITCHVTGDATLLELPPLVTSCHGPFKARFSGKYPVDVSLRCPETKSEMSVLFEGDGQARNGTPAHVTGVVQRSVGYRLLE